MILDQYKNAFEKKVFKTIYNIFHLTNYIRYREKEHNVKQSYSKVTSY